MGQIATDIFNRANQSPLAGNWTTDEGAGLQILSNAAASNGIAGARCSAFWNANAFPNDQYSEMKFSVVDSATFMGPAVRMAIGGFGYLALYNIGVVYFQKSIGGSSFTNVSNAAATVVAGDILRIEVKGTSIAIKVNGVTKLSATDSTLASGSAGLWSNKVTGLSNYWAGGNFVSGSRTLVGAGA